MKEGQIFHSKTLTLFFQQKKENPFRIGIIVSNKIDKRAVVRNKIRRTIREVFKTNTNNIQPGCLMVFMVKKLAPGNYEQIKTDVENLLTKLNK